MKGRLKFVLPALALLAVAAYLWRSARPTVTVATATAGEAIDAVPAVVGIRPAYEITIASEVDGRVLSSDLKLGQRVKKGATLVEIDPTKLKIEADRISAQLRTLVDKFKLDLADKVALERKKQDLANYERLYEQKQYSEQEIQRRRQDYDLFVQEQTREKLDREQNIRELETSLRLHQQLLDKTTIVAAVAGTVTDIYVHPGELVADRTPVARMVSDEVVVEARVNEEDFAGIHAGLDARVRLLAYGDEQYPARIVQVLPTADSESQQYRVILTVDIPPERLLPGLTGEASIIRARRADSLLIPRQALVNGKVFAVRDGVVRHLPVKTGFIDLNRVQILEGLNAGDLVAISDLDALSDGQAVNVRQP